MKKVFVLFSIISFLSCKEQSNYCNDLYRKCNDLYNDRRTIILNDYDVSLLKETDSMILRCGCDTLK